jgi:cytochrome b6-f complex iron-sulfur subunit
MPDEQEKQTVAGPTGDESACARRRAFICGGVGVLGACYAGAIAYPIFRFLNTPAARATEGAAVTQVSLKDGADKLPPGSAKMFRFGTKPAILIRRADSTWAAFDAVCTHLGCTVQYQPAQERLFCACHGGTYDARSGEPIAGPPPKALRQFKVEVKDGEVIVGLG